MERPSFHTIRLWRRTKPQMPRTLTRTRALRLGPRAAGLLLTTEEFDRLDSRKAGGTN